MTNQKVLKYFLIQFLVFRDLLPNHVHFGHHFIIMLLAKSFIFKKIAT